MPQLGLDDLPTAGVVALDCAATSRRGVSAANAQLAYFDFPKNRR